MQAAKKTISRFISVAILLATLFSISTFSQGFSNGFSRFGRSNVTLNPNPVNFGSLNVGAISGPVTVTLTNQGFFEITVTRVSLSLAQVGYSGPALPVSMGPGQSMQVTLSFTPSAAQSYAGQLTFTESNGRTVSAQILGTGVAVQTPVPPPAPAQLNLSSSALAFGSVAVGSAASQTVTVSNTGGSNLTILGVTLSGPGLSASGVSSGLILTPGQSVVLTVAFDPASSGSVTGSVSISTDVAGSQVISLSGSGAQTASPPPVALLWVPSASTSVVGYNVYRATSSGGEAGTTPINGATPVVGSAYTDTNVVDGATYYYALTAVDSSDHESADSNEASVSVP